MKFIDFTKILIKSNNYNVICENYSYGIKYKLEEINYCTQEKTIGLDDALETVLNEII